MTKSWIQILPGGRVLLLKLDTLSSVLCTGSTHENANMTENLLTERLNSPFCINQTRF